MYCILDFKKKPVYFSWNLFSNNGLPLLTLTSWDLGCVIKPASGFPKGHNLPVDCLSDQSQRGVMTLEESGNRKVLLYINQMSEGQKLAQRACSAIHWINHNRAVKALPKYELLLNKSCK